jgi:hypothetical protein
MGGIRNRRERQKTVDRTAPLQSVRIKTRSFTVSRNGVERGMVKRRRLGEIRGSVSNGEESEQRCERKNRVTEDRFTPEVPRMPVHIHPTLQ